MDRSLYWDIDADICIGTQTDHTLQLKTQKKPQGKWCFLLTEAYSIITNKNDFTNKALE